MRYSESGIVSVTKCTIALFAHGFRPKYLFRNFVKRESKELSDVVEQTVQKYGRGIDFEST